MGFLVEKTDGVAFVVLQGAVDSGKTGELGDTLRLLLDEGCDRIVLDLAELMYICSLGIGVLAKARGELKERQGQLVLLSPRADIHKLLTMLRLDRIIPIVETREQALSLCD